MHENFVALHYMDLFFAFAGALRRKVALGMSTSYGR